jgi:hypothetical protein
MRQPVGRKAAGRWCGFLAVIIAMELAAGLIAGPAVAAQRRSTPRHVSHRAQPQPPATAARERDRTQPDRKQSNQKQPDQKQSDRKQSDQKQPDQKQPDRKQSDQKQPDQKDDAAAHEDDACLARLRAADVRFDIPAPPAAARSACVIDVPVRLRSLPGHTRTATEVRLPQEPIVSCEFAEKLTGWLGSVVAPVVAGRMSADLRAVRTGPGYECRNRNGAANGKLSEHALGKAIDIMSFELSGGKSIPIKPDGDETGQNVVASVRTAACGWFTTVLGPGADEAHANHLHVDMLLHGSSDRYRICQ